MCCHLVPFLFFFSFLLQLQPQLLCGDVYSDPTVLHHAWGRVSTWVRVRSPGPAKEALLWTFGECKQRGIFLTFLRPELAAVSLGFVGFDDFCLMTS